jgi:hypothetical protein
MIIPLVIGVNPLQTTLLQLGIVSGRVALLLRSTEIHPVLLRFVNDPFTGITPPLLRRLSPGRGCEAYAQARPMLPNGEGYSGFIQYMNVHEG